MMNLNGLDAVTKHPINIVAAGADLHVNLTSGSKSIRQDAVASFDVVDGLHGPTALLRGPISLDILVDERDHARRFAEAVMSPEPVAMDPLEENLAGYVAPDLPPSMRNPKPTSGGPTNTASLSDVPANTSTPWEQVAPPGPTVSISDVLANFSGRPGLPAQLMTACLTGAGVVSTVGLTMVLQRSLANPDRLVGGARVAFISGGIFGVLLTTTMLGGFALCLRFVSSSRHNVADPAANKPVLGAPETAFRYAKSAIRLAPYLAFVLCVLAIVASALSFEASGFRSILWLGMAFFGPLGVFSLQVLLQTLAPNER